MEQPQYAVQLAEEHEDKFFMVLLRKENGNLSTANYFVEKTEECSTLEEAVRIGFRETYNVEIQNSI